MESSPIRTYLEWGTVLVFAGEAKTGAERISSALTLDPKSDEGYARRGWARGMSGDFDGALEDENRAIEFNSASATHLNSRAWVLCKLGRWRDAVIDCNSAIKLDKSLAYAFKNRSLAQWGLGKNTEALADLAEVLRLSRSDGGAPAIRREDVFNWCDEASDWEKAIINRENDAIGDLGWGIALWMSGQGDRAEDKIRSALGIDPQLQIGVDVLASIEQKKSTPRPPREPLPQ